MRAHSIFKNFYRDSVALMQLSAKVGGMEGVELASALMGTPANQEMMVAAGLLDAPMAEVAPNDLVFVVKGAQEATQLAVAEFERLLTAAETKGAAKEEKPFGSLAEALKARPEATLALISVPGEYAGAEAMKALHRGLNVMLFSDNVPEWQEIALKKYAAEHNLLVMGPDCGTAIIAGVPLAFANVVGRGSIGVVGASGTGTQEVTTIVDQLGGGVSHAIGTGGHDLSVSVGGITMRSGIAALAQDADTKIIVLVSKPPAKEVADAVLAQASSEGKPVVVCFLGAAPGSITGKNITQANTLEEAAHKAIALANGQTPSFTSVTASTPRVQQRAAELKKALAPGQKYVRGLYSGGTFCYEALLFLQTILPEVFGNTPTGKAKKLNNIHKSQGHTVIDLGDDDFTRGKPHPMIDPSQRNERLLQEAADPETAVVLLDVVIGYGANADPAGELAGAVREARAIAKKGGRELVFIGFVCGTDKDVQGLASQRKKLEEAGVHLCSSNAEAIALTGAVLVG